MWFLILQILVLLALAAFCGAALAWWWLSRGREDVTGSYEDLQDELRRLKSLEKLDRLEKLATREELDAASAHMVGAIVSLPQTDLTATEARLADVERQLAALAAREPDQSALFGRLDEIGRNVAGVQTSVDGVGSPLDDVRLRLMSLEASAEAAREVDLGPVHSALLTTQLEIAELKAAAPNLAPVQDRLGELAAALSATEQRIQTARASDIDALTALIAEVASGVAGIPKADLTPVTTDLAALRQAIANLRLPETDLSPILGRLDQLSAGVDLTIAELAAIDKEPTDLSPVLARLGALEREPAYVGTLIDRLSTLEREPAYVSTLIERFSTQDQHLRQLATDDHTRTRLDTLTRQIQSLGDLVRTPTQPDYAPVLEALYSIDGREDLAAVENRLTALEYSLAALHHVLRSRPETARADIRPRPQAAPVQPRPVPPPAPPAEPTHDPVAAARRPGDQANLLTSSLFGPPDDLEQINGVGPILASLLRDIGVYYFWQVAEWTPAQVDWVDSLLQHFRGRIRRDDWVGHARQLAAQPGAARRPARIQRPTY